MKIYYPLAFLVTSLLLVGCGKSETSTATENTAASSAGDVFTITIEGNDQMRFDRTSFTVSPGQKVRLTLENVGKMPIEAMGHNLVVLNKGVDYKTFGAQIPAKGGTLENDYLPASVMDQVLAHTKVLGPGEKQTIEFTAPSETGDYAYVCTFPGHFTFMHGVMTVK